MTETIFPKGFYCYTSIAVVPDPDRGWVYKIKTCPFYVHKEGLTGVCSALNAEIEDQVKICGINEFSDDEIIEMMNEVLDESKI